MQLIKEMLLAIIKSNEELSNNIEEKTIDYFTKKTMKNCTNKAFKEEFDYYYKDNPECPYCGSRSNWIISTIQISNHDKGFTECVCSNCKTKIRIYDDGTIEKL